MSTALLLIALAVVNVAQAECPLGGSSDYCGKKADGSPFGNYGAACSCQPYFCCSTTGFCGPEPGIPNTNAPADYCGAGKYQSQYGATSYPPAPTYFLYIGTGNTENPAVKDTLYLQEGPGGVNSIPLPKSGNFYFIIFVLSDQWKSPGASGNGQSTGSFGPLGLYSAGNGDWTDPVLKYLKPRGKLLASIGGDTNRATKWDPTKVNQATYVSTATASLLGFKQKYGLSGFDINYEESIVMSNGNTEPTWLNLWCQIVYNLKKDGSIITFAPYPSTQKAYKDLQNCLATPGTNRPAKANVDYIVYQTQGSKTSASLTSLLNTLQTYYAPTKVIASLGNTQVYGSGGDPNIPTTAIKPLLQSGVISGVSIFDADQSLATTPQFRLATAVWGS